MLQTCRTELSIIRYLDFGGRIKVPSLENFGNQGNVYHLKSRQELILTKLEFRHLPNVHYDQGQEIEIITKPPLPINTDGELLTHTPAKFRLIPKAIKVMVP